MSETEFLVLRLYGPLAAWGDVAVGEIRPVRSHPGKSALIGLLSAALGIKRENTDVFRRMSESYGFAVADEGRKTRLRDFHTAQHAPVNKGKIYGSGYLMNRQRELSIPKKDLDTTLTYRDYICDVVYTVAVWVMDDFDVPFSLADLRSGLREPVFFPYLGRKSCVLCRPMEPQIIFAEDPKEAILSAKFYGDSAEYAKDGKLFIYRYSEKSGEERYGQIIYEGDWNISSTTTEEIVRDEPLSRTVWQFSTRRVKRAPFCRGDS